MSVSKPFHVANLPPVPVLTQGAKFAGFESLSITLIVGMFLGGIPEAAASAAMLRRAGFTNRSIFLIWSTVLVAGVVAAIAGKALISDQGSSVAVLAQAVAGGAILALVTHAMIPEALHKGGSTVVLFVHNPQTPDDLINTNHMVSEAENPPPRLQKHLTVIHSQPPEGQYVYLERALPNGY